MTKSQQLISFTLMRDALWGRRKIVITMTLIGLFLAITIVMSSGGKYLITMTLIPAETDTERAGLTAQLPSFLSSGSDLPVSKFAQFQAEIFSYQTATLLDDKYAMLCDINPKRCDMATHTWTPKPAWRKTTSLVLSTILGKPPKPDTPQIGDLVDYVTANVNVAKERLSSVTTITTTASDPTKGIQFLNRLVDAANQTIRERDRTALRQYVDYLSKRLENLGSVGQRAALDNLLMTEERRLMLTEVQVAYAATPLDGPNAIPSSSASKVAAGAGIGFALGCIIAMALELLRAFAGASSFLRRTGRLSRDG